MPNVDDFFAATAPDTAPGQAAAFAAQGSNPDAVAKTLNAAKTIGMDPSIANLDPKGAQDLAQQHTINAAVQHPTLNQFYSTVPSAAELSTDDAEAQLNFANSAQKAAAPQGVFSSFGTGFEQGSASHDYGIYNAGKMAGVNADDAIAQSLATINQPYTADGTAAAISHWVGSALGNFYGMGKTMAAVGAAQGAIGAASGAVTGSAVGAPVGGAVGGVAGGVGGAALGAAVSPEVLGAGAIPGEIAGEAGGAAGGAVAGGAVGGLAGAGIGGAAGFISGAIKGAVMDIAATSAGTAYAATGKLRDSQGLPLTHTDRVITGLVAGGAAAVAGTIAPTMTKAVGPVIDSLATKFATSAILKSAVAQAGAGVLKAGINGAVINAAMQAASDFGKSVSVAALAPGAANMFNDPAQREEFTTNLISSAENGFALFGLMHALPAGLNPLFDALVAHQSQTDSANLDEAFNTARATKLHARSPDMMAALGNIAMGGKTVNVPAEAIAALREQDPTAMSYVTEPLDDKITTGDSVEIPAGDYLARTTPEEHAALRDKIVGDSGFSNEEAAGLNESPLDQPPAVELPETKTPEEAAVAEHLGNAVGAEKQAMWLSPIMDKIGDMSKDDFTQYNKALGELAKSQTKGLYDATLAEITARTSEEYNDKIAARRAEFEPNLDALRPDLDALTRVTGGIKLDPSAVEAASPGVKLPKEFLDDKGVSPELLAEVTGHDTGKSLVDDLAALVKKKGSNSWDTLRSKELDKMAKASVDRTDGKVSAAKNMQAALDHVMSKAQLDVLAEEMKLLGGKVTSDGIERMAEDLHDKLPAKEAANIEKFKRRIGKFGLDTQRKLLRRRPDLALQLKQKQAVNFAMAREAVTFKKLVERGQKLIKFYSKDKAPAGRVQEYTDQIHNLLSKFGIRVPRAPEELHDTVNGVMPGEFIHNEIQDGKLIYLDDLTATNNFKPIKGMSKIELAGLIKTLQSLDYVSKEASKIQLGDAKRELAEVTGPIVENLRKSGKVANTGLLELKDKLITPLRQLSQMAWDYDFGNLLGPMNEAVMRPWTDADYALKGVMKEDAEDFADLYKDKDWVKSLEAKLANTKLMDTLTGEPRKLTRGNLIKIMANMGTDSNLKVLLQGNKWELSDVEDFVRANATDADRAAVRKIWNMFERHWPEVQRVTREKSGVPVRKIRGRILEDGTEGGYLPLMADKSRMAQDMKFDPGEWEVMQPFVTNSAFKARTGAVYPVDLSFEQLPHKLIGVLHAITHYDAIEATKKVLGDTSVRRAIMDTRGKPHLDAWDNKLKYLARNGSMPDTSSMSSWENILGTLRTNTIVQLVGLKPSSAFIHALTALGNSIQQVGEKEFLQAMWTSTRPGEMAKAYAQSKELPNRSQDYDMDLKASIDRAFGQHSQYKLAQKTWAGMALSLLKGLDYMSAVPTFIAARDNALRQGMSIEDAAHLGDMAVKRAHGTASAPDRASIFDENGPWQAFTMFYGVFNNNFNRLHENGIRAGRAYNFWRDGDSPAARNAFFQVFRGYMYNLIVPALVHQAIRGNNKSDNFSLLNTLEAIAEQGASGIPIVRDVANALATNSDVSLTPLAEGFNRMVGTWREAHKDVDGDPSAAWFEHLSAALRYGTGFGTDTLATYGQVGIDSMAGHATDLDMRKLILDGKAVERKE